MTIRENTTSCCDPRFLPAPKDMTHENTRLSCLKTVEDLQCGYLDLLLTHWPGKAKLQPADPRHAVYRKEVWLSLEQLQREGGYIFLKYFQDDLL